METQKTVQFNQKNIINATETYRLDNCEVASVENFTSANKPAITFKQSIIYVNAEFIKCAPEMIHVLFLIDRAAKNLILRPCDKLERDAVRLRTFNDSSPKPRRINAADFTRRLYEFMQWDIHFRYRVTGNLTENNNIMLAVFDLNSAVKFTLSGISKAMPIKSNDIQRNFGVTLEERNVSPLVPKFAEDTAFSVEIYDSISKEAAQ